MDRHVELGAGLGGLLLQRMRAEGTGEDEPPEGFDGSVEVPPACVRRLAGAQAAAEEAQRILNAPVLGDPRVRRERHHLVEGEAGSLPPALLLVLLRGQVPVSAPASRGVAANVLSLEGVGEEDADDAGEAPDRAGPDGLVVPPAQVCPKGEEPVEKDRPRPGRRRGLRGPGCRTSARSGASTGSSRSSRRTVGGPAAAEARPPRGTPPPWVRQERCGGATRRTGCSCRSTSASSFRASTGSAVPLDSRRSTPRASIHFIQRKRVPRRV